MKKIKVIIAALALAFLFSCAAKEMTPATEIVYEGELIGTDTITYPSAKKALELCMRVKSCMGLHEYSYQLPKIRGMSGGERRRVWGQAQQGLLPRRRLDNRTGGREAGRDRTRMRASLVEYAQRRP